MAKAARITLDRRQLATALGNVAEAVGRSGGALPILAGVHLAWTGRARPLTSRLTVTATDLDVWLRHTISDAEVQGEPGAIVVPADVLRGTVANLDADTLTLEPDTAGETARLRITAGRTTVTLDLLPHEDWPRHPAVTGRRVDLDDETIDAINIVARFTSSDEYRPTITAVHIADGQVTGTDSYRIARAHRDIDIGQPILLPTRAAALLPVEGCTITVGDHNARWTAGPLQVTTRLVDGTFPDCSKHFDTFKRTATVELDRADAHAAVLRLLRLGGDAAGFDRPVMLEREGPEELLLTLGTGGASVTEPLAVTFTGRSPWPRIGINPRFLAELLDALQDDTVWLHVQDRLKPALAIEDDICHLLMPVRV